MSINFENCSLNLSLFYQMKLKGIHFNNCELKEADFTGTDLSNAQFEKCELAGAIFDETNLEKADFRSSFNYTIDPEMNRLKKTKFSRVGIHGLLHKHDILIE